MPRNSSIYRKRQEASSTITYTRTVVPAGLWTVMRLDRQQSVQLYAKLYEQNLLLLFRTIIIVIIGNYYYTLKKKSSSFQY